jgi:hypothetical protein
MKSKQEITMEPVSVGVLSDDRARLTLLESKLVTYGREALRINAHLLADVPVGKEQLA